MRPAERRRRPAHRPAASLALVALALLVPATARTQKPSPQEAERRRILDQLGLDKTDKTDKKDKGPPAPAMEAAPAPAAPDASKPPPPGDGSGAAGTESASAPPPPAPFKGRVHQILMTSCRACHGAGGPAAATRLILDGSVERDHAVARRLVDVRSPRRSLLLTKATGEQHAGGATLPAASDPYRRLLRWISSGAALDAESPPPGSAPTVAAAPPPAVATPKRSRRPPAPATAEPGIATTPADTSAGVAPGTAAAAASGTPPAETGGAAATPPAAGPAGAPPARPGPPAVATGAHAVLLAACRMCHAPGAVAGLTRFVLTGPLEGDLTAARAFVTPADPTGSALVTKAAGQLHGGGAPWPEGHPSRAAVLAWIHAGTPVEAPAVAAAAPRPDALPSPTPSAPPAAPALAPPVVVIPGPRYGHGGAHPGAPLAVSFWGQTLALNGRFDLNYERRQFQTNPFADGAVNALPSYHHFVFLSRTSTVDPFTLTAELVELQLFEAAARLSPRRARWFLNVRAGKLLVPFGTEPLFHQSYGGHQGFDQRILPAIWTSEAVAVTGGARRAGVSFSGDLYLMRGYALRSPDAILNLKTDLSPVDEAKLGLGTRVGLSFGPLSVYYSTLTNPLGYGRLLFLQAVDVDLWRWRRAPLLDRLVLAAGFLRGDVSGGGEGRDYYHLATYVLARVYVLDWLAVQYRQGLRMLGNKRGFLGDDTRLGPEDGSTHNFAITARHRGLQATLAYFINLEKAGEIDDDLLRLSVAYEF